MNYKKRDVDAVACAPASVGSVACWFVGSAQQGSTTAVELLWNLATQSGTWSDWSQILRTALGKNKDLDAITCTAANRCWAVGSRHWGRAVEVSWNGSGWTRMPLLRNTLDVEHVACATALACWATGSWSGGGSPTLLAWNGSAWGNATATLPPSITGGNHRDLEGLACGRPDDCWIVGSYQARVLTLLHWDGAVWTDWSGLFPGAPDLEGLALVGPQRSPRSAWREVYP